jgi:nitroimidazol reductase NimA-like FMN-containing flavoprotein (pyridoxamine 5'-phosphate oxidase superfamily)
MMRRKEKQITTDQSFEIVENAEWGVLSLTQNDNNPYSIPLSFALLGKKIYLHGAHEGTKIDLIKKGCNITFTCVGKTEVIPEKFTTKYESAIVYGRARIVENDEERVEALVALIKKYSPDYMVEGKEYIERAFVKTAVIAIDIGEITGKAEH